MYEIISMYTVLYLFITFTSQLFHFSLFSLLREGYVLILIFLIILEFKNFKISKKSFFCMIFIASCSISYVISSNHEDAMSSLLLYISGPLIFICLSGFNYDEYKYTKIKKYIRYFFIFAIITALLIYPFQKKFYILLGLNKGRNFINTFRYRADGSLYARMSGFAAHPTVMGFITLSMIINYWLINKKKKSVLCMIPFYLTNTRSVLFGVPFAIFSFLSKKKKIIAFFLGSIVFLGLVFFIINSLNKLDPSSLIHFADLFLNGPKLISKYILPFGLGQGTMSPFTTKSQLLHVESDIYIAFIQLGYIGLMTYLVLVVSLGKTLRRDNNPDSRYCYFLLLIVNLGCIVLSYYIIRFISNYMWIELGLYFSYRRNYGDRCINNYC